MCTFWGGSAYKIATNHLGRTRTVAASVWGELEAELTKAETWPSGPKTVNVVNFGKLVVKS